MRFPLGRILKLLILTTFIVSLNLFVVALYYKGSQYESQSGALNRLMRDSGILQPNKVLQNLQGISISKRSSRSLHDHNASDTTNKTRNNSDIKFKLPVAEELRRDLETYDIFISVKTTYKYHQDRVALLLDTWVQHAIDATYFFTDKDDTELNNRMRGHLVNTNCTAGHSRSSLCCKMSVEYDFFIASGKKWFCHVDDDTYINIPALLQLLSKYNHSDDVYIGKPSLNHPIEVYDHKIQQKIAFWFATGGAGICISKGLALKMIPFMGGGRLRTVCDGIRLPDDCTVGYIISHKMGKSLTKVDEFHSHLETLSKLNNHNIEKQITFSYMCTKPGQPNPYADKHSNCNAVKVTGFSDEVDKTRFRSVHCILHPYTPGCPALNR